MMSSLCLFLLASAVAPAPMETTAFAEAPAVKMAVAPTATVNVLVTDRRGNPLSSAHVIVDGESSREGTTNKSGRIVFSNMKAGSYMLRVERDKFIAFEKEFDVRGTRGSVVAAISPVASLPARPSTAPASVRPAVAPTSSKSGQTPASLVREGSSPQIVSIPELVEKSLGDRSVKESPIGCSGLTNARLIQVSEPLIHHLHSDAEEMLYVVAGEASLTIGEKMTEKVKSGWFSIIPRGVPYALARTGRNPVILLSVLGNQTCARS